MTVEIASVICGGSGPIMPGSATKADGCDLILAPYPINRIDNTANLKTPCECYQQALDECESEILILAHDDIEIFDPEWLPKVLALFENPACVCVGLGGATELGREGLYKRPYRISDMARGNYASAQRDWAVHGGFLDGARRVAVLDAFFMAVRADFLRDIGGWPVKHLTHHCLDLWLACEAARHGKEVWAVGIDCMHYGGGTSTKPVYGEAKWLSGGNLVSDHEAPHKRLHEAYRDVLPIRVTR